MADKTIYYTFLSKRFAGRSTNMTPEERQEYVKYRIQSAHKTLEAAKVLADNEFWNSAVNRLYYSLFYAVNALLVLNEIHTKSHAATKSQFAQHFVKTGKFDKKYGVLLSELTKG